MRMLCALLLCINVALGLTDGVSPSVPIGTHGEVGRWHKPKGSPSLVRRMERAVDEESEGEDAADDSELDASSVKEDFNTETSTDDEEAEPSTDSSEAEFVAAGAEPAQETRNRLHSAKTAQESAAPPPMHRSMGEGTFDLAELAQARLQSTPCPQGVFNLSVYVYETSLCVYPSGGMLQYHGIACGPANTLVQWTGATATTYGGLDPSIGASICSWNWLTHVMGKEYGGKCGVAPTIAGASNLPMTCTRYNEVAAAPMLTPTIQVADVDLLMNGGFEVDYTPWAASYSSGSSLELPIAGWIGGGASMIRSGTSVAACGIQAPEGNMFVQLASFGAYVTQTVEVTPYTVYELSFQAWSCAPARVPPEGLVVYPKLCVSLDEASTPILTINATSHRNNSYYNITVVPETSQIILSFAVCATNSPVFLDSVSVDVSTEVHNPSFEADNSKFENSPAGVIWTAGIGGSLVQQWTTFGNINLIQSHVAAWGGMPAPNGNTFLGMVQSHTDTNSSGLSQSFFTIPGKVYVLRFSAVSRPGLLSADLSVHCPDLKTLLLKLCKECGASNPKNALGWAAFNQWTTTFVASRGLSNVTFSTESTGAVFVDSVTVAPLTMFKNSGFETTGGGAIPLIFYYATPPRWTSDSGNIIISTGDLAGVVSAKEGLIFIGLRGNPSGGNPYIRQGLTTCVGCSYTFSIWAQPYNNLNASLSTALCITAQCLDQTNSSNPVLCGNAVSVPAVTTLPVTNNAWMILQYDFIATTTWAIFTFANCGDPYMENILFLDGLNVTENY